MPTLYRFILVVVSPVSFFIIKSWFEKEHSLLFILFVWFLFSSCIAFFAILIQEAIDFFVYKENSLYYKLYCKYVRRSKIDDFFQNVMRPKLHSYFTEEGRRMKRLIEEAQKDLTPKGSGVTCMIQNKYSREYTDYYLNQLAEFFEFDFFKNRKEEIVSNLKENQCFRSMRDILAYETEKSCSPKSRLTSVRSAVSTARIYSKHCLNGEISQHRFEDMMFFDGLIMNNKRNIDDFGFIVDKEKKDEFGDELCYTFICFYDEYNSIFDHLNGLDEKNYHNARKSLSSWIDNDIRREFIGSTMVVYVQQRHTKKMSEFLEKTKVWKFKDNDLFHIDEPPIAEYLNVKLSVYDFHIQRAFKFLPGSYEERLVLEECMFNPEKFNEYMKDAPQTEEFQKRIKKAYYNQKLAELRHDPKINPRKKG